MRLTTETFEGKTNYLASSHIVYKKGGVTIDNTKVSENESGKKIVKGGSFIGMNSVSGKAEVYSAAVAASKVTGVVLSNNAIDWIARVPGVSAPSIALVDPEGNSKALSVSVSGSIVSVSLATDGTGAITSTAADVIKAVVQNYAADQLLYGTDEGESDGTGVVAAVEAVALIGGADSNVIPKYILFDDVDVTEGDYPAGVFYQGSVLELRLPVAPDDVVKENMPMIQWQ